MVLTTTIQGQVYIYFIKEDKLQIKRKSHFGQVYSSSIMPNKYIGASAGDDRSIMLWQLNEENSIPFKRIYSKIPAITGLAVNNQTNSVYWTDERGQLKNLMAFQYPFEITTLGISKYRLGGILWFDHIKKGIVGGTTNKLYTILLDSLNQPKVIHSTTYIKTGNNTYYNSTSEKNYKPYNLTSEKGYKPHNIGIDNIYQTGENSFSVLSHKRHKSFSFLVPERVRNGVAYNTNNFWFPIRRKDWIIDSLGFIKNKDNRLTTEEYGKHSNVKRGGYFAGTSHPHLPEKGDMVQILKKKLKGVGYITNVLEYKELNEIGITISSDAIMRFWNLADTTIKYSLISFGKSDRMIITPDNYYMVSKGGYQTFGFRQGTTYFSPEQFDLKYNRPDKVLAAMGIKDSLILSTYYYAYQKRLKSMGFDESMLSDNFHIPKIEILTNNLPITTVSEKIKFKIRATDSRERLDRLNLYVNDIPIFGKKGLSLKDKNISIYEDELEVALSQGQNKIQVSVLNSSGAESYKNTFYIQQTGKKKKANLYIYSIGISKHKSSTYNLDFADKDANDIKESFQNSTKNKQFNNIFVHSITNEEATKSKIQAIKQQLLETHVDDQVLIFYSGHGLLTNDLDYILATYDIDFNKPNQNGILYEELEDILDGIPARNKALFIDACHSGEIDKQAIQIDNNNASDTSSGPNKSVPNKKVNLRVPIQSQTINKQELNSFMVMQTIFADLRRSTGATVISSASGTEYAREGGEWTNGVFTHCILEGLNNMEADYNKDKKIMLSELQKYLNIQVPLLTDGQQQPTSRIENMSNDFRIW